MKPKLAIEKGSTLPLAEWMWVCELNGVHQIIAPVRHHVRGTRWPFTYRDARGLPADELCASVPIQP